LQPGTSLNRDIFPDARPVPTAATRPIRLRPACSGQSYDRFGRVPYPKLWPASGTGADPPILVIDRALHSWQVPQRETVVTAHTMRWWNSGVGPRALGPAEPGGCSAG